MLNDNPAFICVTNAVCPSTLSLKIKQIQETWYVIISEFQLLPVSNFRYYYAVKGEGMETNQEGRGRCKKSLRVLEENNPVYFQLLISRYCMNRLNDAQKKEMPEDQSSF